MTFLYLNSNEMGSGDPALGQKLLTVFLRKLADSDTPVNALRQRGMGRRVGIFSTSGITAQKTAKAAKNVRNWSPSRSSRPSVKPLRFPLLPAPRQFPSPGA